MGWTETRALFRGVMRAVPCGSAPLSASVLDSAATAPPCSAAGPFPDPGVPEVRFNQRGDDT